MFQNINRQTAGNCTPFSSHSQVIDSWQVKKCLERLCKEMASFPLLKRYVFYHIHMEVKENAQE